MSGPASLSSPEDALRLAEVALGPDDSIAIVDGAARFVMPITGPMPPDGVLRLDELLLEAVGDHHDARLVLVTRRHTGPSIVLESELAHWRSMQARHHGRALELADWLVFLDDGTVVSLAELAGPASSWGA